MQRSSQLAALSREHHVALEIALRLQRADKAQTETVRQATLDFWSSDARRTSASRRTCSFPPWQATPAPTTLTSSASSPSTRTCVAESLS